jgi:hypothetical protein
VRKNIDSQSLSGYLVTLSGSLTLSIMRRLMMNDLMMNDEEILEALSRIGEPYPLQIYIDQITAMCTHHLTKEELEKWKNLMNK